MFLYDFIRIYFFWTHDYDFLVIVDYFNTFLLFAVQFLSGMLLF